MPTFPLGVALLNFAAEMQQQYKIVDAPWGWPVWTERVGSAVAPWHNHGDLPHPFGWSQRQIEQAKSYVDHFFSLSTSRARLTFARVHDDNQSDGRRLVNNALNQAWGRDWHISTDLRTTLSNNSLDLTSILTRHGERRVCLSVEFVVLLLTP